MFVDIDTCVVLGSWRPWPGRAGRVFVTVGELEKEAWLVQDSSLRVTPMMSQVRVEFGPSHSPSRADAQG